MRGFTLIELLIVIAILALLVMIGVVNFYNINSKARDSARKADIYQIATALEVNKTASGYVPLQQNQFSSFQWADVAGNAYCISPGNPPNPVITQAWEDTCPVGFIALSVGVPGGNINSWKVCSFLENPIGVFCKISQQ